MYNTSIHNFKLTGSFNLIQFNPLQIPQTWVVFDWVGLELTFGNQYSYLFTSPYSDKWTIFFIIYTEEDVKTGTLDIHIAINLYECKY